MKMKIRVAFFFIYISKDGKLDRLYVYVFPDL